MHAPALYSFSLYYFKPTNIMRRTYIISIKSQKACFVRHHIHPIRNFFEKLPGHAISHRLVHPRLAEALFLHGSDKALLRLKFALLLPMLVCL
jgi:hypothetical protein